MDFLNSSRSEIFQLSPRDFEQKALELFRFQSENNQIYHQYVRALGIDASQIQSLEEIPFLPIEFFKQHKIISHSFVEEQIFESSGTTQNVPSRHYVQSLDFYRQVCRHIFTQFYGSPEQYHILALLPSYLERNNSSLVTMVADLIQWSDSPHAGFFMHDLAALSQQLRMLKESSDRQILLIGVTFALLDLAEQFPQSLTSAIIMETGGMKGRRQEMIREEVHQILKDAFQVENIHSEYGMTELLSQAYSQGQGIFRCPPWMRVFLRDLRDPLCIDNQLTSGALNIIDLANLDSCAFIATQDIASQIDPYHFRVLGRSDHSEIRGCNLLYEG